MQQRTVFLAGIVLGGFLGFAYLAAGPLTLLPGVVLIGWLLAKQHRPIGLAGGLVGFGTMWFALVGQATYRCDIDPSCTQPDGELWLMVGGVILACGVALGLTAWWVQRQS